MSDDPYCWPGTDCLENKLGIMDPSRLAEVEARLVGVREVRISRTTIPGSYNLEHLKQFHLRLFGDVYAWAGETRTVDITKADSRFCHWRYIDDEVSAALSRLDGDGYLVGYNTEAFVRSLAYYYGELNACHPFREGNGRCLRAFFRQLGAAAGYQLDWSELSRRDNIEACRENLMTTDTARLVAVLRPVVRHL